MSKIRSQANIAFSRRDENLSRRLAIKAAELFQTEHTAGVPMIVAAIAAIVWANSTWSDLYYELCETTALVRIGGSEISLDLRHAINDFLMPLFFFIVGLELKHEATEGELSSWKRATMPLYIGAGGMIFPAAVYLGINVFGGDLDGWAIPMATDIAFVIAILVVLGDRVPTALRVLTLAFAAIDDVGSVLAIALFYSENIAMMPLALAGATLICFVASRLFEVRSRVVYIAVSVAAVAATYASGVHTTIMGVILGLLVSSRPNFSRDDFAEHSERLIDEYRQIHDRRIEIENRENISDAQRTQLIHIREREEAVLGKIDALTDGTESPVKVAMRITNPWVSYLVLPLFALANAGVTISADTISVAVTSLVAWGVFAGLAVGKPVGILLAAYAASKLGWAEVPTGIDWRSLIGMSFLAGIGFTVSLFIADLAFASNQLEQSKIGILAATVVSTLAGVGVLITRPKNGAVD